MKTRIYAAINILILTMNAALFGVAVAKKDTFDIVMDGIVTAALCCWLIWIQSKREELLQMQHEILMTAGMIAASSHEPALSSAVGRRGR